MLVRLLATAPGESQTQSECGTRLELSSGLAIAGRAGLLLLCAHGPD